MTKHLHFIREEPPEIKEEYKIHPMYCPECNETVYVIHVGLPPEIPKQRKKITFKAAKRVPRKINIDFGDKQ